jgi:hypothetical protein
MINVRFGATSKLVLLFSINVGSCCFISMKCRVSARFAMLRG